MRRPPGRTPVSTCCFVFPETFPNRAASSSLPLAPVVAPEAWVIWDEIVVAYALGLARGHEVPRPQLQPDLSFSHPDTMKRITWLDEIDTEQLWRDFTRKIDSLSLVTAHETTACG